MTLHIFHEPQLSGEWVATCEQAPGWFSFGESLEESCYRAEHDLRDHLMGRPKVAHYEVATFNRKLRVA